MITPITDLYWLIASNLLWTEGIVVLVPLGLIGLVGYRLFRPLFYAAVVLFLGSILFFRNPQRLCVDALYDPTILVSPADGTVVFVGSDTSISPEYTQKVAIFMSPLDVHVNWTPFGGIVERIEYTPGQFFHAMSSEGSERNEHNDITIRTESGSSMVVRQIAGAFARRIVTWVSEGDQLTGPDHNGYAEKIGMIRFGSRVELFLPSQASIVVKEGQQVYGGQTVLGRMG